VACWLASDLAAGISGQVVKVQGGVVQLLEGWHPVTEVRSDSPWTLDAGAPPAGGGRGALGGAPPRRSFPPRRRHREHDPPGAGWPIGSLRTQGTPSTAARRSWGAGSGNRWSGS